MQLNFDKIEKYVFDGLSGFNYYEESRRTIIRSYGEARLKLVCQLLAATSMNNYMKSNVTQMRKALYQIEHGLPFKGYLGNVVKYLELAKKGEEFPGRKTNSFWKNLSGEDENCVVVDIWMLRAFGITNRESPTKRDYDAIENWVQQKSIERYVKPCQLQSMIWCGVRQLTNGKDETNFSTVIERTANNLFNCI